MKISYRKNITILKNDRRNNKAKSKYNFIIYKWKASFKANLQSETNCSKQIILKALELIRINSNFLYINRLERMSFLKKDFINLKTNLILEIWNISKVSHKIFSNRKLVWYKPSQNSFKQTEFKN